MYPGWVERFPSFVEHFTRGGESRPRLNGGPFLASSLIDGVTGFPVVGLAQASIRYALLGRFIAAAAAIPVLCSGKPETPRPAARTWPRSQQCARGP